MKKTGLAAATAAQAVEYIRSRSQERPAVGMVLGSGLGEFGEKIDPRAVISYKDIPGFGEPSVPGHSGRLILGSLKGRSLAVLQGRYHLYEGYSADQVVFPVRVLSGLGVTTLIVTSAAGGINRKFSPGDVMLIEDHLNLLGDNPLRGSLGEGGAGFVEMSDAYDPALRARAGKLARRMGVRCHTGVLAAVPGPSYETPAEVGMLAALGADAVCMSTVPEVIMARRLGMRVLGLLLITNRAAGGLRKPTAPRRGASGAVERGGHEEVLRKASERGRELAGFLEHLVEAVDSIEKGAGADGR